MVTEALKKMSTAVRFALVDEILLFLEILHKLGHVLFLDYLENKFDWIKDIKKQAKSTCIIGHPLDAVRAFPSHLYFSRMINVARGSRKSYYIDIYNHCSLLYFRFFIEADDVSLRIFYSGKFDSAKEGRMLVWKR